MMDGTPRAAWVDEPSDEFKARNPQRDKADQLANVVRTQSVAAASNIVQDMDKTNCAEWKRLILRPSAPLVSARAYLDREHCGRTVPTLHHQNATFFSWRKTHYCEITGEEIRSQLYAFLDRAEQPGQREGETIPFNPTKSKVANVVEALAAETQLPSTIKAPCWLDDGNNPDAKDLVSCTNGLLYLPTREVFAHSPRLFSLNALEFPYDSNAAIPLEWLKFLKALWPDDPQSITMLQEMFGLLLTGDTSYQKAFLLVGPKRSGKGTIARVLTKLLGAANVCGPTLSSLAQNFGMSPMIGKRLAIISDARLGGKADHQIVVERILAVTGEDSLDIDRKFRDPWTGKLETRILMLTNELPKLADASGAFASRFMILLMKNSFFGKEDQGLADRLIGELPGILNWSLDGWKTLQARRRFVQPASSAAAQRDFEDLGSPIGAFVRDCCIIGPTASCRPDDLYKRWLAWCHEQNITHPGTVQTFGRDLRSVIPGIRTIQHRVQGTPERFYEGVTLASAVTQ
jgi:putative DNA primase/helicase